MSERAVSHLHALWQEFDQPDRCGMNPHWTERFRAAYLTDVRPDPPAYNHTRGDSALTPCPECAAVTLEGSQAHEAEVSESRSPDGDGLPMIKGLGDGACLTSSQDVLPPQQGGAHARHGRSGESSLKPADGSNPSDSLQPEAEVGGSDTARLQQIREAAENGAYHCREHWGTVDADADVLWLIEQCRTVQQERDAWTKLAVARKVELEVAEQQQFLDAGALNSLRADVELANEQAAYLAGENARFSETILRQAKERDEARADVARLTGERDALKQSDESLRASFAAFADRQEQLVVQIETQPSQWGHLRYQIVATIQTFMATARKYADGQPAYYPTYKKRAEHAEQQVLALREGIEQLLVSVEATHDVTQWFASIAKLSALLAAIKET